VIKNEVHLISSTTKYFNGMYLTYNYLQLLKVASYIILSSLVSMINKFWTEM